MERHTASKENSKEYHIGKYKRSKGKEQGMVREKRKKSRRIRERQLGEGGV